MKFINLTQHEINEATTGLVVQPTRPAVRLDMATTTIEVIDGIPISRSEFVGTLTNLPEPQEGVMYIISALALNGVPDNRTDVVAPGDAVRDKLGKVVACRGFRRK